MRTPTRKAPSERAVDALRGAGGRPLPPQVQQEAAQRYGFGFGHVRVHDGPGAHAAAGALHASAYTVGSDIAFGAGRYAPESPQGRALLRHELRHVAQQHWAVAAREPVVDAPDSAHEQDARAPLASDVPALPVQRIQCAPEEEAPYSLGTGLIDTVGRKATSDASWPFIKAVLEGFVGGLKADVRAGRADAAKAHLSELMVPWNAARFYGGYLVGLVIGLVSPITDLVKGVVGLVRLGLSGLEWLAKWSPLGIAVSPERQRKIAELNVRLNALMGELGGALASFVTDPKGTVQKFSGLLDNLMQMAQSKARDMGASGAHAIFDLLGKDFYEMGKGIGEVVGTLVAQVLMLVFSEAIGNLIAKGASLVGKAAEFVAGKAVQAFGWIKGVFLEAGALLRKAVNGALKFFKGVVDKAVEAFDALVAVFSEAAAGEQAAAGVGKGVGGTVSTNMESRMVSGARTTPTTVADLRTPKVHPSNVNNAGATPKPAAEVPKPSSAAADAETLTPQQQRQKDILEEFSERQELAEKDVLQEQGSKTVNRSRKQAGVSLEEDHHIATRYLEKNKALFKSAGTHVDADLNLIKDFPEHGQLRGWYDWEGRSYKFHMKGHHPDYNRWVTDTLTRAVPPGLPPDVALSRIMNMNARLETIIRQHPEVLSHGPGILPEALRDLVV